MTTVLVTGGARSGKSSFVLKAASGIRGSKAFIATAEALDEEMHDRIRMHQVDRGDEWITIEEPLRVTSVLRDTHGKYRAVVLDCLTVWLSNFMMKSQSSGPEGETTERAIDELVGTLRAIGSDEQRAASEERRLFIVTNEVGMGIVPDNALARQFRDLAGTLNQRIAEVAHEVYLVAAGIPVRIK